MTAAILQPGLAALASLIVRERKPVGVATLADGACAEEPAEAVDGTAAPAVAAATVQVEKEGGMPREAVGGQEGAAPKERAGGDASPRAASSNRDGDPAPDDGTQGQVLLTLDGGHVYVGGMEGGLMHGNGTYTWTDGVTYTGDFAANDITGQGEYRWGNGDAYQGQVVEALRHGHGRFAVHDSGTCYVGGWRGSQMHGEGTLTYEARETRGSKHPAMYKGSWLCNQKHGYGVMSYPTGNEYAGYWVANQKQGHGIMRWRDRGEVYEGEWAHNLPHGYGTYTWGRPAGLQGDLFPLHNTYTGEWRAGLRHGKGKFVYASGAWYDGEWEGGRKHGRGVYVAEDGKRQVGIWVQDHFQPGPVVAATKAAEDGNASPPVDPLDCQFTFAGLGPKEQRDVNCIVFRHISALRKLYQRWASKPTHMTRRDVWRLLQELPTLRTLGVTLVELDRAVAAPYAQDAVLHDRYLSMHDPDMSFIFHAFLDALVRIGQRVYAGRIPMSSYEAPIASTLSHLLQQDVLPLLASTPGQQVAASGGAVGHATTLKRDIVQGVVERHGGELAALYADYVLPRGGLANPHDATMTLRTILHLLRVHGLMAAEEGSATRLGVEEALAVFSGVFGEGVWDGSGAACNLEWEVNVLEFAQCVGYLLVALEAKAFPALGQSIAIAGPTPAPAPTGPPMRSLAAALLTASMSSLKSGFKSTENLQQKAGEPAPAATEAAGSTPTIPTEQQQLQDRCMAGVKRLLAEHAARRASGHVRGAL